MWDGPAGDLAEAEAAHKMASERMHQAIKAQERDMREAAERAEAARHASLYRARQEELSRKMHELEATKAAGTELFARQKEGVGAQRLDISR